MANTSRTSDTAPPSAKVDCNKLLVKACRAHALEDAQAMVAKGASLLQTNRRGYTPLYWACRGKEAERVALAQWILSCKEGLRTLNVSNEDGWTPLICAAYFGNAGVVRVLLANDANVSVRTRDGRRALEYANYRRQHEVCEILEGMS